MKIHSQNLIYCGSGKDVTWPTLKMYPFELFERSNLNFRRTMFKKGFRAVCFTTASRSLA